MALHPTRSFALCVALQMAAGCATQVPEAQPPRETAVLAEALQAQAIVPADKPRYLVDAGASEIRLLVFRAGPLARVGHNHVIVGRVQGEIRAGATAAASGFRLEVPVESFVLDPPAARTEEGDEFAAEVSEPARRATRQNLLGPDVLDAEKHALIRIESIMLGGPDWSPTVTARVTLRDVTRDLRFPVAVFRQRDTLTVVASFRLRQSEFAITPFTTLNGGLQVHDALDIRIRLVARRE